MKKYDVAIIGGSLGGVQSAYMCAKQGKTVLLTEETDWIGGQVTSQAVPPDEHSWIERFGATKRYLAFREDVRAHYRSFPDIVDNLKTAKEFCPGQSWVSRVSHEPKVALAILERYLQPYIENGMIDLRLFTIATGAEVKEDVIQSVTIKHLQTGEEETIFAKQFLDATDCGDLLPLVGAEYVTGAEGKDDTAEPHAPSVADPYDMQPITWVAALELCEESDDYKIPKPELYDYFSSLDVSYDDNKLFSWYGANAETRKKVQFSMFNDDLKKDSLGLWSYRRIIAKENYKTDVKEVSLINWPQNDYNLGNIYEDKNASLHKMLASSQTLCFVYYLQNHAKRIDGGFGYPVRLCNGILGTETGLAKAPYIRESRRILSKHRVVEQDLSKDCNDGIRHYEDSVGVGHYAIDIHLTTKTDTFLYSPTYPFEIPMGVMIPKRLKNLLPACKNVGCTHLTNGCYRLHPVEWNIGEVAGLLAAYCITHNMTSNEVYTHKLKEFQQLLVNEGVQLHWDESEM